MLILFAFFPFALMLLAWRRWIPDWRDRLLAAGVAWGFYAVVLTEVLSVFDSIAPVGICAGWIAGSILVIVAARFVSTSTAAISAAFDNGCSDRYFFIPPIVLLAAMLGGIAWVGPPNNWDSMAYHMPRVVHWMQDHNVGFYATGCLRQLEMPPGAEYLILHFQLLSGNDRWADMVQWFAYIGCIVGVSCVARSLGGSTRAQLIAALFAATLPMACLQSVTTQNDLVSAFWLICFINFVLRLCDAARPADDWSTFVFVGASLGLALVTKSTMYILTAPFAAGMVVAVFWRLKIRAFVPLALLALIGVSINLPTYCRNYRFSHTFLGNGGYGLISGQYTNVHPGLKVVASNVLRNAGLEFAVGPVAVVQQVDDAVRVVHRWLNLNPDDPDTALPGCAHFDLAHTVQWNSEDQAANPAHVILIIGSSITAVFAWRSRSRKVLMYGLAIAAGFVLFCGYLRMQPWNARLHLPLLIASAALVGVVLERQWKPGIALSICAVLPLLAMPWIFASNRHPLVEPNSIFESIREDRYFDHQELRDSYKWIVRLAVTNHVKQVAVIGDGDCWEYPLEAMLREHGSACRVEAFPGVRTFSPSLLHTRNPGFDPMVKPYLIVRLTDRTAEAVEVVRQ